ncbi:MAG: DUF4340 domain-containing protein [Bacteroidales bacterium]|nr:DUF4340 domain-containing protein [Bacteroidales bacterium]
MKSKKNLIITTIVVLLGVATVLVVLLRGRSRTFSQDFQIEAAAHPGRVSKIYMADKENHQVVLEYVSDSVWLVDGLYPASYPMVELMLQTLSDMRIRNQVNKSAAQNVTKQMAAKSVKVEVYYKDYRINWFKGKFRLFPFVNRDVIYVGHDTQDMMATYMYREGDRTPYIVNIPGFRGCLSPRFVVDSYAWRSHSIVSLPVQRIAKVELQIPSQPEESFLIEREGEGFVFNKLNPLQRMEGFDTARVAQLLSSFVNLNFDEFAKVVPQVELDTTFAASPRTILKVTDIDGNTKTLKTYIKYSNPDDLVTMPDTSMYQVFDINRLYAILDDKDTVLIQYYIFDNILQPASFFLGREHTYFAR